MFAMQYQFILPRDYDMSIIRQRIEEKGHLMDHFPGLHFKAYLYAEPQRVGHSSLHNYYAPFYVWQNQEGMQHFLEGPGFAGLCASFGRPEIKIWSLWTQENTVALSHARWATLEHSAISQQTNLLTLRTKKLSENSVAIQQNEAIAGLVGFEPANWCCIHAKFWHNNPGSRKISADTRLFEVGHVSMGESP